MKTLKFASIGFTVFAIFGLMAFALQGQTQEEKGDHMEHSAVMQDCANGNRSRVSRRGVSPRCFGWFSAWPST